MTELELLVAGVDGGGTGSRCLVLDSEGQERGRAEGEPALVDPAHPLRAARAIAGVVSEAVASGGGVLPLQALWAGLAGAGHPRVRAGVEAALRDLRLAREVRVGTDVEAAHRDAFEKRPGILLVVGTGSALFARDAQGKEIQVGGWGSLLGEEGSGYWVGLQALRAVIQAADGRGPQTELTGLILDNLGLATAPDLVPWTTSATKGDIAALAPVVLRAAEEGDGAARSVRDAAVGELSHYLSTALDAMDASGRPVPVALVGGLVDSVSTFRNQIVRGVEERGGAWIARSVVPARGAARLALELAAEPRAE